MNQFRMCNKSGVFVLQTCTLDEPLQECSSISGDVHKSRVLYSGDLHKSGVFLLWTCTLHETLQDVHKSGVFYSGHVLR
jgi:hypothetical protein